MGKLESTRDAITTLAAKHGAEVTACRLDDGGLHMVIARGDFVASIDVAWAESDGLYVGHVCAGVGQNVQPGDLYASLPADQAVEALDAALGDA